MANIVEIIIKGVNKSKQALTTPINDLADLKKAAVSVGPAFAAGAAGAAVALGALVKSQIDVADETNDMSQRLGISTEALSTLRFAAGQTGTSMETLEKGIKALAISVDAAANGDAAAIQKFKELGVAIRDSNGHIKSADVLYKELADKVAAMPNGLQKTAFAAKAFGAKLGPELIPMLNEGSAGIENMQAKARELGLEISGTTAANADRFNDSIDVLKSAVLGAGNQLASSFLPGMVQLSESMTNAEGGTGKFKGALQGVIDVLKFLGKVAMTVLSGINSLITSTGEAIGGIAAAMFLALTGDMDSAGEAIKTALGDLETTSDEARKNLDAIWSGTVGPTPPNPGEHKAAYDEIAGYSKDAADKIIADHKRMAAEAQGAAKKAGEAQEKESKENERRERERARNAEETQQYILGGLLSATEEGSAIHKAAAIVSATIDAYKAANTALGAAPPPYGAILAAAVAGIGLANVAKIASMNDGGELGSNTPHGDKTLFKGNSGEWVFNKAQLSNLSAQLDEGSRPVHTTVMLDSQPILDVVSKASRNGRVMISAGAVR